MNPKGRRNGGNNRRKNRQQTQNPNGKDDEQTRIVPNLLNEDEDEISDEEHEDIENEQQQQSAFTTTQRHQNKTIEESIQSSKPQASITPVKQPHRSNHVKFSSNQHDYYPKSSSYNNYSNYNSLPPRFQRQQRERGHTPHRHRRRGSGGQQQQQPKRFSFSPEAAERDNEFIPSSVIEQQSLTPPPEEQPIQQQAPSPQMYNHQIDTRQMKYIQRPEYFMHNGYSSESDIVTGTFIRKKTLNRTVEFHLLTSVDSSQAMGNTSMSSAVSTPMSSESSLQRLDLVRSLSSSHSLLEELITIFDTTSFSSDELELILNKITTKHVLDKHDVQRILTTAKNNKTLERILEETYRSQAKILAIELQSEKNRVLELTKTNSDLETTIRQFQQQQPNSIAQYQQAILPYQMQLRRLADENARLQHQLHAYAMLPATLNELKQQHYILSEQIRQITLRNSALENEAAESQRASKHAAEIYKKGLLIMRFFSLKMLFVLFSS